MWMLAEEPSLDARGTAIAVKAATIDPTGDVVRM